MKKLAITAVAALIALALVAGCEKSAPEAPVGSIESAEQGVAKSEEKIAEDNKEEEEDSDSQWVKSPTYGVKFRVPEDWKVVNAEGGVSATAEDGTTTAVLVGTESESMIESAISELKSQIELKEVKLEKTGLTTVNGMPGTRATGSAVLVEPDGDQEIQFIAYALRVGKNNITLMIFSQAEMYEAQKDIIDGIAQTLVKS